MRVILAVLCGLFAVGYYFLTAWYPDMNWLQSTGMTLVYPSVISAVSLILMATARRLFARDPVLSAWAVLGLAGCLLIFPLIVAREQQAAVDSIEQIRMEGSRKALRLKQLRMAQLRKEEVVDREERSKTDRFVQYEGRIPAQTLASLRELDTRMQAEVKAHADRYARALEHNPTKGPESWIRFRTLDQLEIELASHKALYEQTRSFAQFVESFEAVYTAEIEALALQPPADRIAIAEMERILQFWDQSRLYDLRELDVRLLGSAIAALNVLSEAWGTWSYNPRDKRVSFGVPAQEAAFYEAIQLVQAIAIEVDSIREESDPVN